MVAAQFSVADYSVFALSLVLSAAIGIYYGCTGGKQSTVSEFLMADRKMQLLPASMSLLATFTSALTILGLPAEIYQYGTMYIWNFLSYTPTMLVTVYIYLPVFYNLQLTSACEYLEKRFSRGVRIYGAIVYIVQQSTYMGVVLFAPALALAQVTGIDVWIAILSSGLVCTFYTALGGMKAVMWTDTIQVAIMYAGILAAIIQGCIDQGGVNAIWNNSLRSGRMNFYNTTLAFDPNPFERHTFWTLVIGGFFTWTAAFGVNQSQVQRALSVPSIKVARTALLINIAGLSAFALLGAFAGLIIYSRYKDCDPLSAKLIGSPDQLYPFFVVHLLGHLQGLPGLFTSAIYCGALSTISSCLNSVAAVTLEDLVKTFIRPGITDKQATLVSKILAAAYGVIAIALAFVASQFTGVLQVALSLTGMVGGPILGLYTLGMFFPCANAVGAYVGVSTAIVATFWIGVGQIIHKPKLFKYPLSTENCTELFNATGIALPAFLNATADANALPLTAASVSADDTPQLYKLSYLWFSAVGCLCTIVVGLLVSVIAAKVGKYSSKKTDVDLFSPPIRALYRLLALNGRVSFCDSFITMEDKQQETAKESEDEKLIGDIQIVTNPSQTRLLARDESMSNL